MHNIAFLHKLSREWIQYFLEISTWHANIVGTLLSGQDSAYRFIPLQVNKQVIHTYV